MFLITTLSVILQVVKHPFELSIFLSMLVQKNIISELSHHSIWSLLLMLSMLFQIKRGMWSFFSYKYHHHQICHIRFTTRILNPYQKKISYFYSIFLLQLPWFNLMKIYIIILFCKMSNNSIGITNIKKIDCPFILF